MLVSFFCPLDDQMHGDDLTNSGCITKILKLTIRYLLYIYSRNTYYDAQLQIN